MKRKKMYRRVSAIYLSLYVSLCLPFFIPLKTKATNQFIHQHTNSQKTKYTIMLAPADTPRALGNWFESGVTLICAEELKKSLEAELPDIRVILTRFPGERLQTLQEVSFANRLNVDLYISLHFCIDSNQEQKNDLFLYYYKNNTEPITPHTAHDTTTIGTTATGKRATREYQQKKNFGKKLELICADQAHLQVYSKTKNIVTQIYQELHKSYSNYFTIYKPQAVPFKPLYGLQVPAFACEATLKNPQDWAIYIQPLTQTISTYIKNSNNTSRVRNSWGI